MPKTNWKVACQSLELLLSIWWRFICSLWDWSVLGLRDRNNKATVEYFQVKGRYDFEEVVEMVMFCPLPIGGGVCVFVRFCHENGCNCSCFINVCQCWRNSSLCCRCVAKLAEVMHRKCYWSCSHRGEWRGFQHRAHVFYWWKKAIYLSHSTQPRTPAFIYVVVILFLISGQPQDVDGKVSAVIITLNGKGKC